MERGVAKCREACRRPAFGRGGRFSCRALLAAWIGGLLAAAVAPAYEGSTAPVVDDRAPADVAELKAMEQQI